MPAGFCDRGHDPWSARVLWIVEGVGAGDGPHDVRSQLRLADDEYLQAPNLPVFRIRPAVAEALLVDDGQAVAELLTASGAEANEAGWFTRELGTVVSMS